MCRALFFEKEWEEVQFRRAHRVMIHHPSLQSLPEEPLREVEAISIMIMRDKTKVSKISSSEFEAAIDDWRI